MIELFWIVVIVYVAISAVHDIIQCVVWGIKR